MGLIEKDSNQLFIAKKITAPRLKEFLDTAYTVQKRVFLLRLLFSIFIKIKIEFLSQNKSFFNIKSYYI